VYYVRAMASDGSAGSDWTEPAIKFFMNTANDAPATPVIANPSNGAGVSVDTPTLAVHNATDLDRTRSPMSSRSTAMRHSRTSWTRPAHRRDRRDHLLDGHDDPHREPEVLLARPGF